MKVAHKLPSSLRYLLLSGNELGYDGVKLLAEKLPSKLRVLDLAENEIGDSGLKVLKLPSSLKTLNLSSNKIGDDGLREFNNGITKTLTTLDLSYNDIGMKGVIALAFGTSFSRIVDISNNKIPEDFENQITVNGKTTAQMILSFLDEFVDIDNIHEYSLDCIYDLMKSLFP